MNREELAHILRAAARIAQDPDVLVIGSQSILGSYSEGDLPEEAWISREADIAFFDDPDEVKSNAVDGAIGWCHTTEWTHGRAGLCVSMLTTWSFRYWWPTERRTSGSPAPWRGGREAGVVTAASDLSGV